MTTLMLLLSLMIQVPAGTDGELLAAVESYWNHLQQRQRVPALEFVSAGSKEHFMTRQEPSFRSWQVVELTSESETRYRVTVSVERLFDFGYYPWSVTDTWLREEGSWKVEVPDPVAARKKIWQASDAPIKDGRLSVLPERLKIHFLNRSQQNAFVVRNGLEETVRIERFDFDRERFIWVEPFEEIPAGEIRKVVLRYVGDEVGKNLPSSAVLVLKQSANELEHSATVVYNYVSPGARALLGLTESDLEHLERDYSFTPKVKVSQNKK
jgi:hypothetical protein